MSIAQTCPRCGSLHARWEEDELFCPDCLLQDHPDEWEHIENDRQWRMLFYFLPECKLREAAKLELTQNANPEPPEDFEAHSFEEHKIPTMDI